MGGDRRSATSTLTARVSAAVGEELRETALARWDALPDVFVWRVRRCVEAVLYAVLHDQNVDIESLAKGRKGLDHLLEHHKKPIESFFTRETCTRLWSLREFGNLAAHYQLRDPVSDEGAADAARMLATLLREFYAAGGGSVPEASRAPIAALTDRNARVPPSVEVELDRVRRESNELQRRLDATPVIRPAQEPRTGRYVGVGVAIAVTAASLGFVLGRSTAFDTSTSPTTPPSLVPGRVIAAPTPTPAPAPQPDPSPAPRPLPGLTNDPAPAPRPVPSPAVQSPMPVLRECPPTMLRIPASDTLAAFCIDRDAVTEGEYRSCVQRGACAHPPPAREPGCNWDNGSSYDTNAANCLSWELARTYCESNRDHAGDLPTRAEWDAAGPAPPAPHLVDRTDEWSQATPDTGPHLLRGARTTAGRFAWASSGDGQGHRNIGFRCVLHAAR